MRAFALRWFALLSLAIVSFLSQADPLAAAKFDVQKSDDGVTVNVDGKLFTRYLVKVGTKPILWPVIGPTGKEMTRAWPMRDDEPGKKNDHVHQKSFWFTHGNVNGVSFWDENPGHGDIVHLEFGKVEGGDTATIVTRNAWRNGNGDTFCTDERTLTFGAADERRWIDFDVTVKAGEKPVKFGDTKEGSFGVRVNESVKVTAKQGGKIVSSEGKADDDAWGQPAPWVDYYGPVESETVGLAILNHPASFRYPTTWHVRTYGLFAANPFGAKDFTKKADADGSHTLAPGESFSLYYRVLLHKGDEKQGQVAEEFARYKETKK